MRVCSPWLPGVVNAEAFRGVVSTNQPQPAALSFSPIVVPAASAASPSGSPGEVLTLCRMGAGVRSMSGGGGSAMPCGLVSPGARAKVAAAFWLPDRRLAGMPKRDKQEREPMTQQAIRRLGFQLNQRVKLETEPTYIGLGDKLDGLGVGGTV